MDSLRRDLIERDRRDTERKEAPLVPAVDAVTLDSSVMSIDETVERIFRLFVQKSNNCS